MNTGFMPLDEFRRRFKVVDPHDLAARELSKYYDPFMERESVSANLDR